MIRLFEKKSAGTAPKLQIAQSPFVQFLVEFLENRVAVASFFVCAALVFAGLFSPLIAPQDPYDIGNLNILDSRLPPGSVSSDGITFLLGSDGQGRDMLSAILYGMRTSLLVGALSGAVALCIGIALGMTAAYFGGKLDTVIMRVVDLHLGFPPILIAIILMAVLGRGVDKIIIALVVVQWARYARTIRGVALAERNKEYIEAARNLAIKQSRIIFRHLLPNCLPPLVVVATVQVAAAISLEATLSFLGVGLPVTKPSLGLLIANGFEFMLGGRYWISFFPGLALLIMVVSINLMGDHMRDVMNPRLKK
jgi:peptide/nickel transport system permease protein